MLFLPLLITLNYEIIKKSKNLYLFKNTRSSKRNFVGLDPFKSRILEGKGTTKFYFEFLRTVTALLGVIFLFDGPKRSFAKNTVENVSRSNNFNLLVRRVELWNRVQFLFAHDDIAVFYWRHKLSVTEFNDLSDRTLNLMNMEFDIREERVAKSLAEHFSVKYLRKGIDFQEDFEIVVDITAISETYCSMK